MKFVTMKKRHKSNYPGEECTFEDELADKLIASGAAVEVKGKKFVAPTPMYEFKQGLSPAEPILADGGFGKNTQAKKPETKAA